MKNRVNRTPMRLLALLLAAALLGTLAGCTAAPAPQAPAASPTAAVTLAPTLTVAEQRSILEQNRELWAFPEGESYYDFWAYTFTDLDHNGRLEVLAASTQGTGIFTYANFYEVNETMDGVVNLYHANEEIEGPDDWPEILLDSLPCYYDSASDTYYYACEGILRDGAAHQNSSWAVLSLKNGVADWEYLGWRDTQWTDPEEAPVVSCQDAAGQAISEQDYDTLVERRCAGMSRTELKLNWTHVPPMEVFTEETESQAPEETAAPIAAQTPAGPQVVITKNPSSEALAIGGRTWFIAHASNAGAPSWELLSPDGQAYSLADAMNLHPGLSLQALEQDTLAVSNVPLSVNGWGVRARFDGQGSFAYTEPAYLYVGDYVNSYASVIQAYKTAYESGNSKNPEYLWNNGLSEIAAYSSNVGYSLKDIDKDGVPELLIAGLGTEDFSEQMIYDLYTLVDGSPVQLAFSYARNRWYLRSDNTLLNEGSSGAANSSCNLYRKVGEELVGFEGVMTYPTEDQSGVRFYFQSGSVSYEPRPEDRVIGDTEFNAKWSEYQSSVFVPPLTKIA